MPHLCTDVPYVKNSPLAVPGEELPGIVTLALAREQILLAAALTLVMAQGHVDAEAPLTALAWLRRVRAGALRSSSSPYSAGPSRSSKGRQRREQEEVDSAHRSLKSNAATVPAASEIKGTATASGRLTSGAP